MKKYLWVILLTASLAGGAGICGEISAAGRAVGETAAAKTAAMGETAAAKTAAMGETAAVEERAAVGETAAVEERAAVGETAGTEEAAAGRAAGSGNELPPGEKQVVFRDVEGITEIPETLPGEDNEAPWQLAERERLRERWEDNFSFPVIFEKYGSDFYLLEGQKIAAGGDTPFYEDRGALLLSAIGVSPADYVVEQVVWDGESYRNEEGILCRSALASGKKRVWDEAVLYRTVEIEDETGEAGGQAAGERAPDGASGSEREGESWLSLLFRAAALMLSLGLLLLAAAALAAWIRKKKKEKEEEKKSPDGI